MKLRRNEVLRYLGYKGQEICQEIQLLIDSCIEEIMLIAKPLSLYEIFDIEFQEEGVILVNSPIVLRGNSIKAHLKGCSQCVILAGTLGGKVDQHIKRYQLQDMTRAVVLDACASEVIEGLCDDIEESMRKFASEKEFYITGRFSPGYGDLAIELQSDLLKQVKAYGKIGVASTSHHILVPRKSVTAIIGLSRTPVQKKEPCSLCSHDKHCGIKKGGSYCAIS